jgi:hypothetical protein
MWQKILKKDAAYLTIEELKLHKNLSSFIFLRKKLHLVLIYFLQYKNVLNLISEKRFTSRSIFILSSKSSYWGETVCVDQYVRCNILFKNFLLKLSEDYGRKKNFNAYMFLYS